MTPSKDGRIKLPKHLGLIPDGSRRWAREQNLPSLRGHQKFFEVLTEIAPIAIRSGVPYVSALIFSTDNWNLSQSEVSYLMKLIIRFFEKDVEVYKSDGIRLVHVGARDGLPKEVLAAMDRAIRQTAGGQIGTLALCINYGGQQEVVDAAKKLLRQKADPVRLNAREFERALYEPDLPPLDLVIRTGGQYRTGGFQTWRAAQAEYVFMDKDWPEFSKQDLRFALLYYVKSQRRFGA